MTLLTHISWICHDIFVSWCCILVFKRLNGRLVWQGLVEYKLTDPFAKAECIVPNGRLGVQLGLARWNSTTDYREKPVFRFDNKFVCSVVRLAAGGHHTCLIYGDETCSNCNTGYMECFGWNDYNQSSVPQCFDGGEPSRIRVIDDEDILNCGNNRAPLTFKEVSAGLFHTCAITTWRELLVNPSNSQTPAI
jgi:hypothetical protein